jgi:glycosyltransferase involved in cell wall biosynthesis
MKWQSNIDVIYNGTRDLSQGPKKPIDGLNGIPFVFHLSRMAKSKNVGSILELAATWPEMNFVLSGPKSVDTDHVSMTIKKMGINNVRLITNIDDEQKSWLFSECVAFIFPSITEGFGLPPIEAMHFGKPVFLSKLTSLPEIGGTHAVYFDDFSPATMRRTMTEGIQQLQLKKEDIKHHAKVFDWDVCADAYINRYLNLLSQPV